MENKQEILDIIRKTRDLSLPSWGNVEILRSKSAGAHDVVTELDEKIEQFLASEFSKVEPDIQYVGEEFGGDRSAKTFWLVDPIDGTGHYVRGLPFCTTMVALIENGEVVFGAIYDFVNDVMYHATRGEGAYQDSAPIRVSTRDLSQAYMGYESRIDKEHNLEKFLETKKHFGSVKFLCSGYEHILVATGKIEGRIAYDPYGYDYDFAPGSLLVQEAGGVVANIGKTTYDHTNTNYIASNPIVFEQLTSSSTSLFPLDGKE